MKCVKLLQTGEVYRIDDLKAHILVDSGQAKYVTKDVWKKVGRKTTKNKEKEKS